MKVSKKLLAFLLAIMMVFTAVPVMSASAKTVDSGKCGDNVKWSLDSNGTLTISGKGKMDDYEGYTDQPWFKYAGDYTSSMKIEKIVVKDGVTHVGKNAFYGMVYPTIKSLKLADSVTTLGDDAFFECRGLTDVDLGNGLKKIGKSALAYVGFETVKLPSSLTTIGECAFCNCYNLKSITIPDSVKYIGHDAFQTCLNLQSITLPKNLESIEEAVFADCENLRKITIPDGVKKIGGYAFSWCKKLSNVSIPNSVTKIGKEAFSDCPKLKSVRIPKSVTSIGKRAFGYYYDYDKDCNRKYSSFKIYGYKNSAAQTYAKDNGFKFVMFKKRGSVTLSKTSYVYDGNVKKPTVIVKDANGNKLKNGTDYTVKYSSGRKNVGQYTVTVTFKGEYNGTKKLTFKIVPKSTSISKLTAGTKKFTVSIKKQSTQTTGYQVQYSKNSSMKNATTKTYASTSKTSRTISSLKAKTKYYVRVRTYKNVKIDGKTTKLYSSWSSVKSVKTK